MIVFNGLDGAPGGIRDRDALRVKIRQGGHVQNKAIYVAIAVNPQGNKEVLGLWRRKMRVRNSGCTF